MVFATCQAQCQPCWIHYLIEHSRQPYVGGVVTFISERRRVRLSTGQASEGRGGHAKSEFLVPGFCCCLRAKLFYCWLRTAKKGKNSPKSWGNPGHPKKFPLRDEGGKSSLTQYLQRTHSPKCPLPNFSHYLKPAFTFGISNLPL